MTTTLPDRARALLSALDRPKPERHTSRAAIRLREAADAWSKYSPSLSSWCPRDYEGERLWKALSDAADAYAATKERGR